ncbi:MAG: hypothetical protein JWQ12_337 [Glaciihabitans sp.]|nr:hypothetical protein [Glaciihabitans sp.]
MADDLEDVPLRGIPRVAAQGGLVLAIFAGTIFLIIVVLGAGGSQHLAPVFGPVAIGATALGLVAAIVAVAQPRSRTLGITTLIILLPCTVLSFLTVVAIVNR